VLCFGLIGGLLWLLPKSNNLSLTLSTSYLSERIVSTGCYTAMPATSVALSTSGCWYHFVGGLTGGLPCPPKGGPGSGGVEAKYVNRFFWLFPAGLGGRPNSVRVEGSGSVICWGAEHSQPAIFILGEVIFLPLWPINSKSSSCTGCWLLSMHNVEYRMFIILWRAWKWLLWRWVVTPLWQIILIGVFAKSTLSQWKVLHN
jgi:hypothetical protein